MGRRARLCFDYGFGGCFYLGVVTRLRTGRPCLFPEHHHHRGMGAYLLVARRYIIDILGMGGAFFALLFISHYSSGVFVVGDATAGLWLSAYSRNAYLVLRPWCLRLEESNLIRLYRYCAVSLWPPYCVVRVFMATVSRSLCLYGHCIAWSVSLWPLYRVVCVFMATVPRSLCLYGHCTAWSVSLWPLYRVVCVFLATVSRSLCLYGHCTV